MWLNYEGDASSTVTTNVHVCVINGPDVQELIQAAPQNNKVFTLLVED